ncbi:MAG: hypothetical protein [Caudoviricetes sp.]|nr:MAG: hypothetical protein [Caudoviricetes sp.]
MKILVSKDLESKPKPNIIHSGEGDLEGHSCYWCKIGKFVREKTWNDRWKYTWIWRCDECREYVRDLPVQENDKSEPGAECKVCKKGTMIRYEPYATKCNKCKSGIREIIHPDVIKRQFETIKRRSTLVDDRRRPDYELTQVQTKAGTMSLQDHLMRKLNQKTCC